MSKTLTTTVVIRGQDGLSGILKSMGARVEAFQSKLQRTNAALQNSLSTLGANLSLGQLTQEAKAFNQAMFGVGVASVTEGFDRLSGKVNDGKMIAGMEKITATSFELSEQMGFSLTKTGQIGEVLAKAGMKLERLRPAMESTITLSKADPETSSAKIADFLHTLSVLRREVKVTDKELADIGFGHWIKAQADKINVAAAETKLGAGSIMEGMRQFAPLAASMGISNEEQLSLLMAGVQRGFGAIEFSTAVKSDLTRLLKPTGPGMGILGKYGINPSAYATGTVVANPDEALRGLLRDQYLQSLGGIDKKTSLAARTLLAQGAQEQWAPEVLNARLAGLLAKSLGPGDAKSLDAIQRTVAGHTTKMTGDLDAIRLMEDLIAKGVSDADLAIVFEGRHLARNAAIVDSMRKQVETHILDDKTGELIAVQMSEYRANVELLKQFKGQGLDAIETMFGKTPHGNLMAMEAAIERMKVRLANSGGIQKFVNLIERSVKALSDANPQMINMAGGALALGLAAGPALLLGTAVARIGGLAFMAARGVGALNAMTYMFAARGLGAVAAAAAGGGAIARGFGAAAGGAALLARGLGAIARFTGIGAAIWGAFEIFRNWDTIKDSFSKVLGGSAGTQLEQSWYRLKSAAIDLGTSIGGLMNKVAELMGWNVGKGDIEGWVNWLVGVLTSMTNALTAAINAVTGFINAPWDTLMGMFGLGGKQATPPIAWDKLGDGQSDQIGTLGELGELGRRAREWFQRNFGEPEKFGPPVPYGLQPDGTFRDPNAPRLNWGGNVLPGSFERSTPFGANERPTVAIDPNTSVKATIEGQVPVGLTVTGGADIRVIGPGTVEKNTIGFKGAANAPGPATNNGTGLR